MLKIMFKKEKNSIITIKTLIVSVFFVFSIINVVLWQYYDLNSFDIKKARSSISELNNSVEWITNTLFDLDKKEKEKNNKITNKYREIRQQIVNVINDIHNTIYDSKNIIKKINLYKKEIKKSQIELKNLKKDILKTKKYLENLLILFYKTNNEIYSNWENNIDDIKIIIQSETIPETIASDFMIKSLIFQLNDILDKLKQKENKHKKIMKKLTELKLSSQNKLKKYNEELDKLNQKKNYLIDFIDIYKNNQVKWKNIDSLFEDTKNVFNRIDDIVSDIKQEKYLTIFEIKDKLDILKNIESNDLEKKYPFAWPVYPIKNIHRYFWDETFEKQYWVKFKWIQIQTKQWTPIYSTKDWLVYKIIDNKNNIWINWILILHKNWFVSVYMYLNKILVKEWDIIRRWQIIWYSWWEPWTRWAWFISKYSNLTFFIYKDWIAIDPLKLLDLSVVYYNNEIPEDYNIKYLKDKYKRWIDITDLTFMTWKNKLYKTNNFLKLYWIWVYSDIAFWKSVSKWTNIDQDVLICIAFAESTLWKYLTTSNNIGNVWNDDSWNRISFWSAYNWAKAIANTLNNIHLWNYHTIYQLSRYWNKNGKIYASSSKNREKNVINCLSQIKWYYVPEDYPFRIWLNPNKN